MNNTRKLHKGGDPVLLRVGDQIVIGDVQLTFMPDDRIVEVLPMLDVEEPAGHDTAWAGLVTPGVEADQSAQLVDTTISASPIPVTLSTAVGSNVVAAAEIRGYDTTGDGHIDALDTNGDGSIDMVLVPIHPRPVFINPSAPESELVAPELELEPVPEPGLGPEPEQQPTVEQLDDAAIVIQSAYRNYLAFHQLFRIAISLRRQEHDNEARLHDEERHRAARIIQAAWRSFVVRTDGEVVFERERRNLAASYIQTQWFDAVDRATENRHATLLQAAWRGFNCRQSVLTEYAEKIWAAKEIQRVFQGRKMRKRHFGAICIQSVGRGWLIRKQIFENVSFVAAATIQRVWRGRTDRQVTTEYLATAHAATMMQRHWRGFVGRKKHQFGLEWNAACTIQEHWLEYLLQAQYAESRAQEENAAARLIQAHSRGTIVRQKQWAEIELSAAMCVQRFTRCERAAVWACAIRCCWC